MATTPQALATQANCYICAGVGFTQALKIALLAQIVVQANASADVTPQGLLNTVTCFECALPGSIGDLMEIALLRMLAPV